MLYTTLNAIRACHPCADRWAHLLASLGKTGPDDEPLPFSEILRYNGLDDALWACRAAPQYDRVWRLLAVQFARKVQHLMTDPRSLAALDVAERHANGDATDEELAAARAARDAAWAAAWAARDAAGDAAGDAAWDAGAAAGAAAWAAAWAAAGAAAMAAAWAAAGAAAWAAERTKQERIFLAVVSDAA
jgi:hypothetical protein